MGNLESAISIVEDQGQAQATSDPPAQEGPPPPAQGTLFPAPFPMSSSGPRALALTAMLQLLHPLVFHQ